MILDGKRYILGFNWNAREGDWYVDLADDQGTPICMGIKLTPNILTWHQYKGVGGLPAGDLILFDTQGNLQTASVGFADLGARFMLAYIENADFPAGVAH
jgi:hypothetical protein